MKLGGILVAATITAAGALGFAQSGFATDFTFVVPVNVSNLPSDVRDMLVTCAVRSTSPIYDAYAVVTVPISGGGYHGDVTVAFDAPAGRDPATAATYKCTGDFTGHGNPTPFYFGDGFSSLTFPLQAGAPFVLNTGVQPLH